MGTVELRKEVRSYIDKADERFLRMVDAMRKEYEEPDVVGYEVDGTPITQEDLKKRVLRLVITPPRRTWKRRWKVGNEKEASGTLG